MTRKSPWEHRDQLYKRLIECEDALCEINNIIFAKGAPLGSAEYFKIRKLTIKGENQPMSSIEHSSEMVVESYPVEGMHGYTKWRVTARTSAMVEKFVNKIVGNQSSFPTPSKIVAGNEYVGWYCSEGYTVDNDREGQPP